MSEKHPDITLLQEERFRLIDALPGGVCELLLTEDGPVIQQASDKFYEIIGHSKYQMDKMDNHLCEIFYPPDLPGTMGQLEKLLNEKETICAYVFRVRFPEGNLHWISLRGTVYTSEMGRCIMALVFNNDEIMEQKQAAEIARTKLELALTATGHAVFEYDLSTGTIYDHKGLHEFGIPVHKILDVSEDIIKNRFMHPDDVGQIEAANAKIMAGKLHASFEARVRSQFYSPEAPYVWIRLTVSSIFDKDKRPVKAVGVIESINMERTYEHALFQESQFRKAYTESSLMAYEINLTQDTIQRISGTRGFRLEEVCSRLPNPNCYSEALKTATKYLVAQEDREKFLHECSRQNLIRLFRRGESEHEIEYRRLTLEDQVLWNSVSMQIVLDRLSGDMVVYTYHRDIQERKMAEQEMLEQISKDALTNLLNRTAAERMVQVYLKNLIPSGQIQAFLMMDLNHFKHLNDTYGHLIGDHCLIRWAQSLKKQFRKEDLVARMGGDEFAVLLKNLPDEQMAITIAKKLTDLVKKVGIELELDMETTVSIGIAFSPQQGKDFEKLYSQADKAMYCAKRSGESQIAVFTEDIHLSN